MKTKSKIKTKSPGVTFMPTAPKTRRALNMRDGKNDHSQEILSVLNGVLLPNHASFSQQTAFQLLASKDIETAEIIEAFENWTAQLVREGKIKASPLFENLFLNELV